MKLTRRKFCSILALFVALNAQAVAAAALDLETCTALSDLAFATAKARDSGVTMQKMLAGTKQSGRKSGVTDKEIQLVIETKLLAYRNPSQTPAQIRAFVLNSCTETSN